MNNTNYCEVYYQPGEAPVFCYRSGLMVYEESLVNGVLISCGYNAAGYPLNVLTNCATRIPPHKFPDPSVFHVELDGQSLDYGLRFVDFSTSREDGKLEAVLTLESEIKPARLKIHTILDGSQMFTRYLEIENLADSCVNLSRLVIFGGAVETMETAQLTGKNEADKFYSLGYFDNTEWGREGHFTWHDLAPEITCIDTRFLRERYRHPLIFIRNNVNGYLYFSQIGWSDGCRFTVDYDACPEKNTTALAFQAEITSYNPMMVLTAGEVVTTPEVHMGVIAGNLDEAINEMHTHIRRSVLDAPELNPVNLMVGAGMGAEHDMSVETSKAFMRQFAEMGAEVFIIDAGWVCPPAPAIDWGGYNGINIPNAERYPNGLEELSDYCHSLGMKFALWVEIERLGEKCDAFRDHPEWIANDIFGKRNDGYLDFTNPEAAAWAESELARIIEDYKLDMLRVDYNVPSRNYFAMRDVVPGRKECLSLRHKAAVYKMYQNLKRRFPDVVFENCAGGGGRTDLGMMKAFNHTWVSDWQKAPRSVLITNGMTMALPPERVDRLYAGMGCHEFGSLDLHMRNTMLTHMSLNVIAPAAAAWNPQQMAFTRHSVEVYKNFIRPILPDCKVYHHTPECEKELEDGFCVYEIASPDCRRGALAVYNLTCASRQSNVVIPRGIDPALTYKVTLDNSGFSFNVNGYELMNNGIRIMIPNSMASELVLFEAVES